MKTNFHQTNSNQILLEKNEGFVDQKLLDKRKKIKPEYKSSDLVRQAVLKGTISKADTLSWSSNSYEIKGIKKGTNPSYHLNGLPERYNAPLSKKTS